MNTLPPNEPLDEQEREFARILRALPGGEPPAALDAAILRAATNAAHSSQRPARRILASAGALWGVGSAAAAVLALGVAWQLRYGVHDQAGAAARAPSAQLVSDSAEDESVQVELGAQPANAPMSPPPPPTAAAEPQAPAEASVQRQAPAQPARAAPAPAAAPEPFAADHEDDAKASSGMVAPADAQLAAAMRDKEKADDLAAQGARAEESTALKARSEQAAKSAAYANAAESAPPPPPPPPAYRPAAVGGGFVAAQSPAKAAASAGAVAPVQEPAPAASRADAAALDQVAAVASVAPKTEAPPRKPSTWLADIRKLRDQGRIEEAHAALVEFHKKYPKWVIPTDLAPLLNQ